MKRKQECIYSCTVPSKHVKTECVVFPDDVLGIVYSFLPFENVAKDKIYMVNHQWNNICFDFDFRFALIRDIQQICITCHNSDTSHESMTRLHISLRNWLNGRCHELNLKRDLTFTRKKKQEPSPNFFDRKEFPSISIMSFDSIDECACYSATIVVHIEKKVDLHITIVFSMTENILVYVSPCGPTYDWKSNLNIDPHLERNVVLKVEEKAIEVWDYQVNQPFFESLMTRVFKLKHKNIGIEFVTFFEMIHIISLRSFAEGNPITDVQQDKDVSIHDPRLDELFKTWNLSNLNEEEVMESAKNMIAKIYASIRDEICTPSSPELVVSNAIGRFVTTNTTNDPLRHLESTFTLHIKGISFHCKCYIPETFIMRFAYEFTLISEQYPDIQYCFPIHIGTSGCCVWEDSDSALRCIEEDIDQNTEEYDNNRKETKYEAKPFLMEVFKQLQEKLPLYDLINGEVWTQSCDMLKFIIDHDHMH